MTRVGALLSTLEDPFEIFPLDSVARSLADIIKSSEEAMAERAGPWGVSRKYYSVDQEHQSEVIAISIGATFVLGQTAIAQAVAIAKKLHSLANKPTWLPTKRDCILHTAATFNVKTRRSEMVLINAVANYFKHHYEWPDDWSSQDKTHRETIEIVRCLGLSPENQEDNLRTALLSLGLTASDTLGSRIQCWRERLAENYRRRLSDHGFG